MNEDELLGKLEEHQRQLATRTFGSAGLYAVFAVVSIVMAMGRRSLDDPITLLGGGLLITAIYLLPRQYWPAWLVREGDFPATVELKLEGVKRFERLGLGLRIGYVIIALGTLLLLPRLL